MRGCAIECMLGFVPMLMPLGKVHLASVLADWMAACAASTEVVNPKDRSMMPMSLSIVCMR